MKVSVKQLRETSALLFDHLEQLGILDVELDADYYWHVPRAQVYEPTLERVDLDLGQLSEDWEKLEAIRQRRMPPVGQSLEWLGAILRAAGDRVIG